MTDTTTRAPLALTTLGGVRTVTGSRFLVEVGDRRVLVDAGLFQGLKDLRERNWAAFPVPPRDLDAIVITHACSGLCWPRPLSEDSWSPSTDSRSRATTTANAAIVIAP